MIDYSISHLLISSDDYSSSCSFVLIFFRSIVSFLAYCSRREIRQCRNDNRRIVRKTGKIFPFFFLFFFFFFFSSCCRRLLSLSLLRKINYLDVILSLAFSSMMLLPVIFSRKKTLEERDIVMPNVYQILNC